MNVLNVPVILLPEIYCEDACLGGKVLAAISKSCKHSVIYHLFTRQEHHSPLIRTKSIKISKTCCKAKNAKYLPSMRTLGLKVLKKVWADEQYTESRP